eukprot:4769192-Prymnesium_polylepis.1
MGEGVLEYKKAVRECLSDGPAETAHADGRPQGMKDNKDVVEYMCNAANSDESAREEDCSAFIATRSSSPQPPTY